LHDKIVAPAIASNVAAVLGKIGQHHNPCPEQRSGNPDRSSACTELHNHPGLDLESSS
jgi:hypothetical protein